MGNMIGKVLSLALVVGIGFGLHSLFSYFTIYQEHAKDIAFAVYFLNLGATLLVFFFGVPELNQQEEEAEDDENAN